MTGHRLSLVLAALLGGGAAMVVYTSPAAACGCFTPPDPSVPVVQAGENILFSVNDGVVTAHIQVQYAGPAEEFGWLLPLPSQPELTLGTDELFAQLIATTQPKYALDANYWGSCPFDPSRNGGFPGAASDDSEGGDGADSPLVMRDSVGPYDYAVLRADSKQPMFDWLAANRFFVPTNTESVVDPYIRPNAFFLALKLRKGNSVGDLQPVVLKYQSDLPMIPIILTSVAADPDMGVQVWMLGEHRAIPRNFYHTKINDAKIDWINFGQNYVDVVTDAVDEASGHHSFVTEYAGTSAVMVDVLDPQWRFGDLDQLATLTDAIQYVNFLNNYGYPVPQNSPPFGRYTSQLMAILQRELPVPAALAAQDGFDPNEYYLNFAYYVTTYRQQHPELFADLDLEFDPIAMTDDIRERVVEPTRAAGALFRQHSYLSRLYTTLSPDEMVKDPVFSFNPDLPEVSNEHRGTITYFCDGFGDNDQTRVPARIVTENGFVLNLPDGTAENPWLDRAMPFAHYTEILREEGQPVVVDDNTIAIRNALRSNDGGGCAVSNRSAATGAAAGALGLGAFGWLGLLWVRRRRN